MVAYEICTKKCFGPSIVKQLLQLQAHCPQSTASVEMVVCLVAESFEQNLVELLVCSCQILHELSCRELSSCFWHCSISGDGDVPGC